jgi:hypothetical protein
MWNEPTKKQLAKLPKLYDTEHIPLQEKPIHLHFFLGACDWFISEYDGKDLFWGFCILNGDLQMAEWGYVSFNELKEIRMSGGLEVDRDLFWKVRPANQVELIRKAQGWDGEVNDGIRTRT